MSYLTDDQSLYAFKNTIVQITPDLPCVMSGSDTISFSISNYIASTAPTWATIDSTSGILSITAPEVAKDTEFDFYISSSISSYPNPVQKLIKLTIVSWSVMNWKKCSTTNGLICEVWNTGYSLSSGAWNIIQSSETAKDISKVSASVTIVTGGCVAFASILNTSSIASLWLTINQLQVFLLLLLTKAYIPKDIQEVIKGSDFALNIHKEYSSLKYILF